jgi:hypothetical protein
MVAETEPLLVLLSLVEGVPLPPSPPHRGHPEVYSDHLMLKALVVMLVRRVWTVHGLLALLAEPTPQVARVRAQLRDPQGRCPSRRTWERRLLRLAGSLPLLIALLGAWLLRRLDPWPQGGRAVAIVCRAKTWITVDPGARRRASRLVRWPWRGTILPNSIVTRRYDGLVVRRTVSYPPA